MMNLNTYLEGRPKNKFAKAAGISAAYLSQIMGGDRSPGLSLAFRIETLTDGDVPASSWVKEPV